MTKQQKNQKTRCVICDKEMFTFKHVISQKLPTYCSDECRKKRYSLKCIVCKKEFRSGKRNTKTCSRDCQTKMRRNDVIELNCDLCKKSFKRDKSSVYSGKNKFCSKRCSNNHYSLNNPSRYGGTWTSRRKHIINRDGKKCLLCGCKKDLQVHHFNKVKNFENPNDAHYEENLGTFCVICHEIVEKKDYKSLSEFNNKKDIV